ncbi:TerB family tellurite resistance protein [Paucibacter sp. TC2R-5]|uniref:tellurite resistance TerB family protein n=1 Tax=Paucibacter sp. TC2R-5 TaxID=2893555 RepID=UPI0021E43481|nr:TerB family tellurite resistance protein [Paucibacter sp. TC2R-5]MCV2361231.1 TerB family tellurite resistance protein [Paucibacter sp. TC2R-5]
MRNYLVNSPQAAARIIALTVVADGDIADAEIECLDRLAVHEQLGLERLELLALLDTFCEDLLSSGQLNWADVCPVDERTLADLMGEIQDPELRLKVLRLCVELAEVDAQVDDGESAVLVAAVEHWGLHREMFRSSARN